MLTMTLRQVTALECSVCGRTMGEDNHTEIEVALFGAIAFAQCPCCRQLAPDPTDLVYRRRVREFLKEERDQ